MSAALTAIANRIRNTNAKIEPTLHGLRLAIGRDLIKARDLIKKYDLPGGFDAWLTAQEFSFSRKSAFNYMNLVAADEKLKAADVTVTLNAKDTVALAAAPAKVQKTLAAKVASGDKKAVKVALTSSSSSSEIERHDAAGEAVQVLENALSDRQFKKFVQLYRKAGPALFNTALRDIANATPVKVAA